MALSAGGGFADPDRVGDPGRRDTVSPLDDSLPITNRSTASLTDRCR